MSYPIYFPLYIGEFEFSPDDSKKTRRVTIVMDAHDENVRAQCLLPEDTLTDNARQADDCRLAVPRPYGGPTPYVKRSADICRELIFSILTEILQPTTSTHPLSYPTQPSSYLRKLCTIVLLEEA